MLDLSDYLVLPFFVLNLLLAPVGTEFAVLVVDLLLVFHVFAF